MELTTTFQHSSQLLKLFTASRTYKLLIMRLEVDEEVNLSGMCVCVFSFIVVYKKSRTLVFLY